MVWARQAGVQTLVEAIFFASVQTGPKAYPASCVMGTGLPSWGVNWSVALMTHAPV